MAKKLIDPETCSYCTEEVEDSELRSLPENISEGERLCSYCWNEEMDKQREYNLVDDYYYL